MQHMLSPETKEIQNRLGRYCQTGILPEIQGINRKHISHYRRLVFNIILNNLFQAFPIASKVIGKKKFGELVKDFFSRHNAQTPQIWKLPEEFYEFAVTNNWSEKYDFPWLNDLLLFEWMEIQVHTMPDRRATLINAEGNLLKAKLVVNSEFEIIQLNYPVHLMPVSQTPENKGNYYVLLFRHPVKGTVQFLNLSALFISIIEELARAPASISELASSAILNYKLTNREAITSALGNFIKDMAEQGLILGTLN